MLNKVVDYKLLTGSADDLTQTVSRSLSEGWVPSGTPVMSNEGLVQAMVRFGS